MLRGAGAVLAGTAGAGLVTAVTGTPANAAAGGNVIMGPNNNADTVTTGITNNSVTSPTAAFHNTAAETLPDGSVVAGPALQLAPAGDFLTPHAPVGSLGVANDGTVYVASAPDPNNPGESFVDAFFTTAFASMVVPINPTRVVDTRDPALRTRILNPGGNLDAAGRLIAGHSIDIDLFDFVFFSYGMLCNLTVVSPLGDGFLTLYPFNTPRPLASALNYSRSLTVLSNFAVTGSGHFVDADQFLHDAVSVFASNTLHVIIDAVAFIAPSPGFVAPSIAAAKPAAKAHALGVSKVKAPSWFKGHV
jgi:hypothetical protein